MKVIYLNISQGVEQSLANIGRMSKISRKMRYSNYHGDILSLE